MKLVHWLFVVSVLLFVTGIGFVIAGARSARDAPNPRGSEAEVQLAPVATVKQIMGGIVGPAANVVFTSVSTTFDEKGADEHFPRTDQEWEAVGNSAAALIESGNLLMLGNRAVDRGDWLTMSRAMMAAGQDVLKAVAAKDKDMVLDYGDAVNVSCDNCHRKYQRQ
jgi:hypothetical protein